MIDFPIEIAMLFIIFLIPVYLVLVNSGLITLHEQTGLCNDCRIYTGTVCGYGNNSDLPFFKCSKCRLIEKAKEKKYNNEKRRKLERQYKQAKRILGEIE